MTSFYVTSFICEVHAGPLSETARYARSRCVVIFIVTMVRLYGQVGWPGCRDLA